MKIIAVVPIKHHSSRVPKKNYRLMNGKPLYYYILETLSSIKRISQIVVDTNSHIIKDGIAQNFPHILVYDRPTYLSGDDVSTNVLLMNVIEELSLDGDIYLHTHTTNPLLSAKTINRCIDFLVDTKNQKYDSLFTVNELHTRLYDKNYQAINHDINKLVPTQSLDPIYEENSCLYLIWFDVLERKRRRIGYKPYLYPISKLEAQDIDYPEDFIITEKIISGK